MDEFRRRIIEWMAECPAEEQSGVKLSTIYQGMPLRDQLQYQAVRVDLQ